MGNLYRIVVEVQSGDMLEECNRLYQGKCYGTVHSDCDGEAVIEFLSQWDGYEFKDEDIVQEEPRWCKNGTDLVYEHKGYTLVYNVTIGGVFMLYREASSAEIELYKEKSYEYKEKSYETTEGRTVQ